MNILFIAVDDLKTNLGCFGDSTAITPNLDALAKKGMVFSKAYCQQAVCAPSRASLMTGQYPDQTGIWDLQTLIRDVNPDIVTIPQYLHANGYQTAGVGKIFDSRSVDSNHDSPSWSVPYGNPYANSLYNSETGKPSYFYADEAAKDTIKILEAEANSQNENVRDYVFSKFKPSIENADVPYDAYVDGAISKVGINLMDQVSGSDKPFFLAVGFNRPHLPFNSPKEFWDLYERNDFQIADFQEKAKNSTNLAYHNWEELRSYTDIPESGDLSEEKQLELIHAYYAATSYIDFLIGRLLSNLADSGLEENTAIVLWGDHGWHFGDHNLWCKHSNFEEATHTPLIISYPDQPNSGKTYSSPVEFTDIAPTLCELTGTEIPVYFEGQSLVQAFQEPEKIIRTGSLSQYPRNSYMGYSLRTERYRYTKWVKKSNKSHYASELYDYHTDPLETVNLAFNDEYKEIKDSLDNIVIKRINIPSTQIKINFEINGQIIPGDDYDFNNCEIEFDNFRKNTDQYGKTFFTHVEGKYLYKISAKGFKTFEAELDINNDTTISLNLEPDYYNVTFQVLGEWNNKPIAGSTIIFNNRQELCDSLAIASFDTITYNLYEPEVTTNDGWVQSFNNIEIFSDTTITLFLNRPSYDVTIKVVDLYSGSNIYNTTINLNNTEFITDTKGTSYFNEIEGEFQLNIKNESYHNISGILKINSDTTLIYRLEPSHSQVKFKLKFNTTPVDYASVFFASDTILSNALGISTFKNIPTRNNYEYKIQKDRYIGVSNELYIRRDTTIIIQLEKTSTSISQIKPTDLHFWPNPAKNYLNIYFPDENIVYKLTILNILGEPIDNKICRGNFNQINISSLNSGNYFIRFQFNDYSYSGKLIVL